MNFALWIFVLGTLAASDAVGQDTTVDVSDLEFSEDAATLDKSPFLVPSASGVAGAALTSASYMEAAYLNPAGIGGGLFEKKSRGWARELAFPYGAISLNQKSYKMRQEFIDQGAESDSDIGRAIVDSYAGERQFGRISLAPSFTFGRVMATYIIDQQLAGMAIRQGSDQIDLGYRSTTGLGIGGSYRDVKDRFQIGIFGASLTRVETRGRLSFDDISSDLKSRADAVKQISETYAGQPVNIGATFRLAKKPNAALAIVLRDAGNTKYVASNADAPSVTENQRLSLGVSANPMLGRWGSAQFEAAIDELSIDDFHPLAKFKLGSTLTFGTRTDFRTDLRVGYQQAGFAYGLGVYLGLISCNFAVHKEEVGTGDDRMLETRSSFALAIDVIEH